MFSTCLNNPPTIHRHILYIHTQTLTRGSTTRVPHCTSITICDAINCNRGTHCCTSSGHWPKSRPSVSCSWTVPPPWLLGGSRALDGTSQISVLLQSCHCSVENIYSVISWSWRAVALSKYLRSPSLEEMKIHSSSDLASFRASSCRALPTRPFPPVTRTRFSSAIFACCAVVLCCTCTDLALQNF